MKMKGFIGSFAIACYGISYLMYRFAGLQTVETSGFYVLICFGVYYILQNGLRSVKGAAGEDRILWARAVLFAASLVTGFHLDGSLPFEAMGWGDFLNYLLCVLGLTPLSGCLFAAVYRMVKKCAGQEAVKGLLFSCFLLLLFSAVGFWYGWLIIRDYGVMIPGRLTSFWNMITISTIRFYIRFCWEHAIRLALTAGMLTAA